MVRQRKHRGRRKRNKNGTIEILNLRRLKDAREATDMNSKEKQSNRFIND